MTLGWVTRHAAERFAERSAYVAPHGGRTSFAELDALADGFAHSLVAAGLAAGDVIALALPAGADYMAAYVGASRVGVITAGINTRLTAPEQEAVLAVAAPALVLRDPAEVRDRAEGFAGAPALPELPEDPQRPVAMVFTSGTTGLPKAAMFGERQLRFITEVDTGGRWADPAQAGTTLAATSFAHVGPMTKLPGVLMRGTTTYVLDRWEAAAALALVAEHRMAGIGGIPTQIALMLAVPDFDRHDLSHLAAIVVGGGPATPALVREARARFAAAVSIRYSCTEAGVGIGTALDAPEEDAEVSVGRPHAGVALSLRHPDDADAVVSVGEVGEVTLRSPAVMSGYWRDPDATAAAFTSDGFVRTGDLGWVDPEGRLRLVGRNRERYVRGGYNVYPMEVEAVLAAHPQVAEIAIVPRPDPVMGEVGVAFVVPRGLPPVLASLRAFAGQQLGTFKLPEQLRILERLPLTAMEKLDRRALRGLLEGN